MKIYDYFVCADCGKTVAQEQHDAHYHQNKGNDCIGGEKLWDRWIGIRMTGGYDALGPRKFVIVRVAS